MNAYIVQRLGQAILVGLIISLVTFLLLYVAKDPARALSPPEATNQQIETLRHSLGLDRPLYVQYGLWLWGVVRGDFGMSLYGRQPVTQIMAPRINASAELAGAALLITLVLGVPLGVLGALYRGTLIDTFATFLAVAGQAMPIFWLGLMLIILFSVQLPWFPVSGRSGFSSLVLPAVTLGVSIMPLSMRLTRSAVLEVLRQDYVRTAHAKGLRYMTVVVKHALRSAATPVILALGLQFGALLGGAVVTETVFAWPGIGQLAVTAVTTADLPVVQAIVLFSALVVILSNLLADVLVAVADPRIRY